RVEAAVGYEIDRLIEPQPVFALIQHLAGVDDGEMFEVFNMGIGFCYVVAPDAADATLEILKAHGRDAQRIGTALADAERPARIPERGLIGRHKSFWTDPRARKAGGGFLRGNVRWGAS